jgi:PEP-CTERM motif
MFKTVSLFTKPADAQLTTSYGSDTLTVTSSAPETNSTFTGGIIATAGSTNSLAGPMANPNFLSPIASIWQSGPGAGGTWQIDISQQLIGSNHLVPSQDPNCASLLCMPAVRATGELQSFQIRFALDAIAQPVPEPSTYAMMAAGLLLIVSIGRNRRKPNLA